MLVRFLFQNYIKFHSKNRDFEIVIFKYIFIQILLLFIVAFNR